MNILDQIIEQTKQDLIKAKEELPLEKLQHFVSGAETQPGRFAAALTGKDTKGPRIIAELKRASPSKGLIRYDFHPVSLAMELEENGAAALSVLTDVRHFQGSPEFLRAAVANVSIPVLRKDFIVDPYQIYEAKAWGASAILLIAAALSPKQFADLHETATAVGLDVLCEIHNADELPMVLDGGALIVGVNSRNLKTFSTDLGIAAKLMDAIPADVIRVAESGIHGAADIRSLQEAGADAFLIGETLMRARHPGVLLETLIAS